MRRVVRSRTYARFFVASSALLVLLGATIVVRTLLGVGLDARAIPAFVLGGAMIALGVVRLRALATMRGRP